MATPLENRFSKSTRPVPVCLQSTCPSVFPKGKQQFPLRSSYLEDFGAGKMWKNVSKKLLAV
jgi:hypothetical protein